MSSVYNETGLFIFFEFVLKCLKDAALYLICSAKACRIVAYDDFLMASRTITEFFAVLCIMCAAIYVIVVLKKISKRN